LRDDLGRRFDVLREMGVGQWSQAIRGRPEVTGEFAWHADIEATYCFGESDCRPSTVVFGTEWRLVEGQLMLTELAATTSRDGGPRPWESGDIVVATGARTIVVASRRLGHRLNETLEQAERGAAVADTFAGPDGPPSRYVIYLAHAPLFSSAEELAACADLPPTDWSTWFGTKPCWAGGMFVDGTDNEVIVNGAQRELQDTLTHELTHAATLGSYDVHRGADTWWLVEGIAEYAAMVGRPVGDYDIIEETRGYVRRSWDGCGDDPDAVVCAPLIDSDDAEARARYGVAFLAVRRLGDTYGQPALLDFFDEVVLDGRSLDAAARSVFGQGWDDVKADCEEFIRSA
jgi:hypothetical protein